MTHLTRRKNNLTTKFSTAIVARNVMYRLGKVTLRIWPFQVNFGEFEAEIEPSMRSFVFVANKMGSGACNRLNQRDLKLCKRQKAERAKTTD